MHIYQFVSSDVAKDLLLVFEFGESSQFVFSTAQKMKFSIKDFFSKCDQIPKSDVTFTFWTPGLGRNGPMKQGLSVSFLGIGSLVFSETQHGFRGPYIVVCDSRIFWKKSPSGKNDQKLAI